MSASAIADTAVPADVSYDVSLRASDAYRRALPFWELRRPDVAISLPAEAVLVAAEVWRAGMLPIFDSLYLQRAKTPNVRQDLVFAGVADTALAQRDLARAITLDALRGRSPEMDALLSRADAMRGVAAPAKERALVATVLGTLELYDDAYRVAAGATSPHHDATIDAHYLESTRFMLANDAANGNREGFNVELEQLFALYGSSEETLRMRLLLGIDAMVYNARRKEPEAVAAWRARTARVLDQILASRAFRAFEQGLLISRFYRAASYYPFLIRDRKMLAGDAELCERHGRALAPATPREALIKRSNLSPMLESMSHAHAFLGDADRARALMREIVTDVDPLSCKAWIQVGEIEQKRGDLEQALAAFLEGARVAPPAARIAWFRAGVCFEQLGDFHGAVRAHLESLRQCPRGVTPLRHIVRLAPRIGAPHIAAWAESALAGDAASVAVPVLEGSR